MTKKENVPMIFRLSQMYNIFGFRDFYKKIDQYQYQLYNEL